MSKLNTFKKLIKQDKRQVAVALYGNIVRMGITNLLSDEVYLKLTYRIRFGKKLDLENPITFNEKLQWLKLYDRNPEYIKMVDKVLAKDYVAEIIGNEYIIPTLGVYDSFDEINFNNLPNKFVLKCNHDSGSIVICKDKDKFDKKEARKKITKALRTDAFFWGREWPYKNVKRKIIAEAYIEDDSEELRDYKCMVFNGKVKCSFVATERFSKEGLKITFFDTNWEKMPFERHYPMSNRIIKKPLQYDGMIELAEKLADRIPFGRIDFYEVKGKVFFGEITLYPGAGWEEFKPSEWDKTLGEWIKLPGGEILLIKENVAIHFPCLETKELTDYKFYCFDGKPMYCQMVTNRFSNEKIDFYDMNWKIQPFVGLTPLVTNSELKHLEPVNFQKMKKFSAELSRGMSFSRIDFYEVRGKLFFGEITLYPFSGFGEFYPDIWNFKLGNLISINNKKFVFLEKSKNS